MTLHELQAFQDTHDQEFGYTYRTKKDAAHAATIELAQLVTKLTLWNNPVQQARGINLEEQLRTGAIPLLLRTALRLANAVDASAEEAYFDSMLRRYYADQPRRVAKLYKQKTGQQ